MILNRCASSLQRTMIRRHKIALGIALALVAILSITGLCANAIVSRAIERQLDTHLSRLHGATVSYKHLRVDLLRGEFCISGLALQTDSGYGISEKIGGLQIKTEKITLSGLHPSVILRRKQLTASTLRLQGPMVFIHTDPKASLLPIRYESTDSAKWTYPIRIEQLIADDGYLVIASEQTPFELNLERMHISMNELGYAPGIGTFCFSDSLYTLYVEKLLHIGADGILRAEADDIHTRDAGTIHIGISRIWQDSRDFLTGERPKRAITEIDLNIDSITTSQVNLVRLVQNAKENGIAIDSLSAHMSKMTILRDQRYPAESPYPMPQEALRSIKLPVRLPYIHIEAKQTTLDLSTKYFEHSKLTMSHLRADIRQLSNQWGKRWSVQSSIGLPQGGRCALSLKMQNNKTCDWQLKLKTTNVQTQLFDAMTLPVTGFTAKGVVDSVICDYSGDKTQMSGTFCMAYHDLRLTAHNGDNVPYPFVRKNARFVTELANLFVPDANPSEQGKDREPRVYRVASTRDRMQPFAANMIPPTAEGIKATFLPGLAVGKRVKKR